MTTIRSRLALQAELLGLALMLAACGSAGAQPTSTPRVASPTPRADVVLAAVQVRPGSSAEVSFLISAPVKEVLAEAGEDVSAGQELIVLDAPQLELAVDAAEQGLIAAQRNEFIQSQGRRRWDGFKFVWVAGPPEQRSAAHARVLQAQAELEAATAQLQQSILRAPFDGTVVSIEVQPGEIVQEGEIVATVGELSRLLIETTDLSERDIVRVRIGQPCAVMLEAFPDPLGGEVTAIAPQSSVSADGDVIYTVTIELTTPPQQLLWGMTGEVEIQVDP